MIDKKKIFIFLPDGVGLRNFAFTKFKEIGEAKDFDIYYWNNTNFELEKTLGFKEIKIEKHKLHPLTPIYSRIRKRIELNVSRDKFKDDVYPTYKFPLDYKGLKNALKSAYISLLIGLNSTEKGVERIRKKINKLERKNSKYEYCKDHLEKHKPDLIFCTTQRATQSISALLAAKDLGIPTVAFVYSWDNVPKAMQVVETDYYCVWTKHMKDQVLQYYPFISEDQIFVTGTPQFEPHYYKELIKSRKDFFQEYNLDVNKKYICFSGDDETTSPLDQYYLEDLSIVVRNLNAKGENLGIIYRKCPVDLTTRYDEVLNENKDLITVIDPLWKPIGKVWNQVMSTKEDLGLLVNTCYHSELVANVCSSTVFDFVIHNKPCIYYNYEQPQLTKDIRDIGQNYKYVHFRSMPSKNAVVFCTDKSDLERLVHGILKGEISNVKEGMKWFKIIVGNYPTKASENIWNSIEKIINEK
ncbi:MAG: UDP-glycosyltransferase [Bacteroidia bacterium]|nr:UDP-glycosyltransferase [Bacteroidia bacterium]